MFNTLLLAQSVSEYARKTRHLLHSIPEAGLCEYKTTAYIKKQLIDMGVTLSEHCTPTGAVGIIQGSKTGAVTAIRADIDALPICEKSGVKYHSLHEGYAHSCGHDGHTAILLGLAKALMKIKEELHGTVILLFQPGEEGYKGAEKLIEAGALDNPRPDSVVALHGWPYLKCGDVGSMAGKYMASADSFDIKFIGVSGHGCRPYMAVNPIYAASAFTTAIQGIVSNEIETSQQAVVTVCSIHAGSSSNIIPDDAVVTGTVRCFDPFVRIQLKEKIARIAENSAQCYMCKYQYNYIDGLPSLINDPDTTRSLLKSAENVLGSEHVKPLAGPVMGAEDFSFMINYIGRGAYLRLGIEADDRKRVLHNASFDFNDDALVYGISVFLQYIVDSGKKA